MLVLGAYRFMLYCSMSFCLEKKKKENTTLVWALQQLSSVMGLWFSIWVGGFMGFGVWVNGFWFGFYGFQVNGFLFGFSDLV